MREALHGLWNMLRDQGTLNALEALAIIMAGIKGGFAIVAHHQPGKRYDSQKNLDILDFRNVY